MKKMYQLLIVMLLSGFTTSGFAKSEATLKGKVTDEQAAAVGFANVAVINYSTLAVVTGAITDMDGNFIIKTPAPGKYLLKINALGFVTYQTAVFEVTDTKFTRDFEKIELTADVKTLKEITVQALRPTIIAEADKMVVSVEATALSTGSTAYEVLEKAPGVWVDQDGNITLNGKGGVQIMINGKTSYLTGKDLQNMLQAMSAENLKDLEIITNPSSKYDAEGASGIININLKKNQQLGLNGSMYGSYQYNIRHMYTSGVTLNIKNGKWNTSTSADFAKRPRYRDLTTQRIINIGDGTSTLSQTGQEFGNRYAPSLRVATDYDLNDNHSIGLMVNLQYSDNNTTFSSNSLLNKETDDAAPVTAVNTMRGDYRNGTFNLHYNGKLNDATTTLSADLDYVTISSKDESSFIHNYKHLETGNNSTSALSNYNPVNYNIYSAKADFGTKVGNGKMELGAKASRVISDNKLRFYEVKDDQQVHDPKRSSHFIFTENILAAYTNYTTKFGNKWTMQAGLRAEQTISEGTSITMNNVKPRNYLNLFPTVFLQQQVTDNYQIGYKYSRRINRPYYGHLNPFKFYIDPYTVATGNPYLKPQYTNTFELTQIYKNTYHLVLDYAVTKDFIAEVPVYNADQKLTIFERNNLDDFTTINATLIAPITLKPGLWEVNNNISLSYQHFTTTINEITQTSEQLNYSVQSNHNILLPKGFRFELSGTYEGPGVWGLFEFKDMWWIDAGLKRSFIDDKLTITLNASDIFKTREHRLNTLVNGNTNSIRQYHGHQAVRLNLRYKFNRGKAFESKKRSTTLDELNRTGS